MEVWSGTLDHRWRCVVERDVRPNDQWHHGHLRVFDGDNREPVFEKEVWLSYGAKFGPDVDDVNEWCALAEGFIAGRLDT